MYYYKWLDGQGNIAFLETRNVSIKTDTDLPIEITQEEYNLLLGEMFEDIEQDTSGQISDSEALDIILGV